MFYVFIKFVFVSIAITDWKVSISYVLTFIYQCFLFKFKLLG